MKAARRPAHARRAASAGLLLRALLDAGPLSRSAIAQSTGLSPASVTSHSADLLASGLVVELPETSAPSGIGRPRVPLDLNTAVGVVGGIHFAVRHATIALLDIRGRVLTRRRVDHDGAGAGIVISRSGDVLEQLLAEPGMPRRLLGIGVATGGWVDQLAGMIVDHGMLGWQRVPVAPQLQYRFGIPVYLDSHARSLARAEQLFGHPRSRESVLLLFVGNVVETAFALGDHVHYGPRSQAGAIAHLPVQGGAELCACGRVGCLGATVSERALTARAHEAGLIAEPWMSALVAAAVGGKRAARELFLERAAVIGRTIGPIIDVMSPSLVSVVEPGIARVPGCLEVLRDSIGDAAVTVTDPAHLVTVTSFNGTALATAGGTVILDAIYRDPLGVVPPRTGIVA
jgi:predicted NBD/HSP70 family sugar kinase